MRGLVLRKPSIDVVSGAKRYRLEVSASEEPCRPWPYTAIVNDGVPWRLLEAGFRMLERWEVLAPLHPEGLIASDIGGDTDRARTAAALRDIRVPIYSTSIVFLRESAGADSFLEHWRAEMAFGDERLAFLRALYAVKPLILALPSTWVAHTSSVPYREPRIGRNTRLVHVEIAPGRYVCCKPEEVETYRARMLEAALGRRR